MVAVLGIDVVNNAVGSRWLASALVSPIAAAIRKHTGEVPHSSDARSGKSPARIGVGPSIPSVRGPVEEVGVVMGETAAAFVHAGDVHVACGKVAGNLNITDETGEDIYRRLPRSSVITRVSGKERAADDIVVVPGNIHAAIEWRRWIVVSPARLSVVLRVRVNAVMGPAIRIPRSRGLIAAKALTSAATIEPDSKPIPGWLVVQNNRVAHRVLEWPLTGRLGQARERS